MGKGAANLDEGGRRRGVLELRGPEVVTRLERGGGRAAKLGHREREGGI